MAGEDSNYIIWLKKQRCAARYSSHNRPCNSRNVDAHHATGAGMALRSHDHTAIPLCRGHHDAIHHFSGAFKHWTRERRREWHLEVAAGLRLRYLSEQEVVCEVTVAEEPF